MPRVIRPSYILDLREEMERERPLSLFPQSRSKFHILRGGKF